MLDGVNGLINVSECSKRAAFRSPRLQNEPMSLIGPSVCSTTSDVNEFAAYAIIDYELCKDCSKNE